MGNPPIHRARKRFGQNFLHDEAVISRIIRAINPQKGEAIVEIGPGLGALTQPLLEQTGRLAVVELDRDLIPYLKANCLTRGELTVHEADALKFDFSTLAQSKQLLRIVGNLPYNISTPLIFHLLNSPPVIQDMHFMLQLEVVNRLAAEPGSKTYGRLSVITQYHCHVQKLFEVGREAFSPAPKVSSAIVRLAPYTKPPVDVGNREIFTKLVTAAFAQRRKTLRNTLKSWLSETEIEKAGVDPGNRAEQLNLSAFASLSRAAQNR